MDSSQVFQRRLACLGVPSRFRIIQRLAEERLCVSELAGNVRLSQSCTTRHLQALTAAGLVRPQRAGKRVLYVLREDDADVARLLEWIRHPEAGQTIQAARRRPVSRHPVTNGHVDGPAHTAARPGPPPVVPEEASGDPEEPRPMHRDEMEDFLL